LADAELDVEHTAGPASEAAAALSSPAGREYSLQQVRQELLSIRDLLAP